MVYIFPTKNTILGIFLGDIGMDNVGIPRYYKAIGIYNDNLVYFVHMSNMYESSLRLKMPPSILPALKNWCIAKFIGRPVSLVCLFCRPKPKSRRLGIRKILSPSLPQIICCQL
jgi:hypothetical protein